MDFDKKKRVHQKLAFAILRMLCFSVVAILVLILGFIIYQGCSVLNWDFLTQFPTDGMTKGGIFPAIMGTIYLVLLSIIIAFPIGVAAGIFMNEYTKKGIFKRIISLMTVNLAGVPSIVFGIFGVYLFVNKFQFGVSILSSSFTLALMALPLIIRVTEESLKAVDNIYRDGSAALGATKWQTTRRVVLPIALPNIVTGLILAVGRVSGETAPILFTGAVYSMQALPSSVFDQTMALPYHLYSLATSNTDLIAARPIAYGTALVLVLIVLILNLLANFLRRFFTKGVSTDN